MRKYITVKYNPELPQLRMQAVLQTNDEVLAARPNINVTGVVTLEGIPLPSGTVSFDGASAFATDAGGTYAGTVPFYYGGNAQMDVYTEPRYTVTPPYRGYYALTANQVAQDYEISINYLILSGLITDSGTGMVADVTNGTDTWQSAANGSYGYYVPYGWSGTTTAISNGSGTFTPAAYVYNAIGIDYANQDFAFTSTIVPPAPVTISGAVTIDTILTEGVAVDFSGVGQFTTQIVDLAIIYVGTVPNGYSGTVTLPGYTPYPLAYDVVPGSRVYTNQTTNLTNENFDISSRIYEISGTVGFDGTLFDIELTNGTDTWMSDAVTGSYGFWVLGGWSGTVGPTQYITDPANRVYTNVTSDAYEEHFQMTQPFLMVADNYFNWNTWAFEVPEYWFIYARNPVDFTYSVYATNAGATQDISIVDTGSYYHVIGVDFFLNPVTLPTPDTYAAPPLPPIILFEGSVFNGTDGSGLPANLYFDGLGTISTDGAGYWSQGAAAPYTGVVYVADAFDGTFDPAYRSYVAEGLSQSGQDFVFWPTAGPAPTDCQIPLGYQTIGDLPTPNAVSRSVNDPVNNLLWYVDDSYDYVYYVDAVAGTFQGSIELTNSFGQSALVYDPTNDKVVVMDWSGSIHVIDPVAKTSTRVPGINMPDPGFHMLAVNDVGTVYATDNRNVTFGSVYAIDVSSASLIRSTKLPIATDSICWASNINKLVINSGGAGQPAFYIFDPATDTFAASTLLNPAVSFRYENFYIPQTGHMLESFSGGAASAVIDISQGTAATQIATIEPTRVSNADIDTCTNHLFVTNGNYAMWEYTLDGSYTLINVFDRGGAGINPNSCSHNRQSNLIYVADYGDGTIYTYMATSQSGTVGGLVWTVDQGVNPDTTGGYAAAQGGLGWFSGSAVGEDNTPFQTYSPYLTAALSNLDAPYPAQMTTVYTGSINDSGNLDAPSYFYIYQNLNGASTSVTVTGTVTGTNTTFSGTLVSAGTVTTGYNTFEVDTQFYCGGNFTVSPCNTYVAVTGSISITPLTPP